MPCRLPPARPTRQHSAVREWPIPNHSLPSRRPFTPTPRIKKCSNESASCPAERRAAHQTRHATLRFTVDPSPPFRPSEHGRLKEGLSGCRLAVSKNTNASPRARMEERRCERAASQAISGALERTPAVAPTLPVSAGAARRDLKRGNRRLQSGPISERRRLPCVRRRRGYEQSRVDGASDDALGCGRSVPLHNS